VPITQIIARPRTPHGIFVYHKVCLCVAGQKYNNDSSSDGVVVETDVNASDEQQDADAETAVDGTAANDKDIDEGQFSYWFMHVRVSTQLCI